jgi:hypothetical protein
MQVRTLPGLGVAIALLAAATSWAQQPSLAEVARREAERRKKVAAPTKVYTNDDVKKGLPLTTAAATTAKPGDAPAPGSQAPAADGQKPASKPEAPPEEGARDEAWWRQRMTELRDQLNRSRLFADALQSRINALWADFTARDDPAQRAVIERDRSEAMAELERVKTEIERHEQAITDLEDEARKAGVPPGWLR